MSSHDRKTQLMSGENISNLLNLYIKFFIRTENMKVPQLGRQECCSGSFRLTWIRCKFHSVKYPISSVSTC